MIRSSSPYCNDEDVLNLDHDRELERERWIGENEDSINVDSQFRAPSSTVSGSSEIRTAEVVSRNKDIDTPYSEKKTSYISNISQKIDVKRWTKMDLKKNPSSQASSIKTKLQTVDCASGRGITKESSSSSPSQKAVDPSDKRRSIERSPETKDRKKPSSNSSSQKVVDPSRKDRSIERLSETKDRKKSSSSSSPPKVADPSRKDRSIERSSETKDRKKPSSNSSSQKVVDPSRKDRSIERLSETKDRKKSSSSSSPLKVVDPSRKDRSIERSSETGDRKKSSSHKASDPSRKDRSIDRSSDTKDRKKSSSSSSLQKATDPSRKDRSIVRSSDTKDRKKSSSSSSSKKASNTSRKDRSIERSSDTKDRKKSSSSSPSHKTPDPSDERKSIEDEVEHEDQRILSSKVKKGNGSTIFEQDDSNQASFSSPGKISREIEKKSQTIEKKAGNKLDETLSSRTNMLNPKLILQKIDDRSFGDYSTSNKKSDEKCELKKIETAINNGSSGSFLQEAKGKIDQDRSTFRHSLLQNASFAGNRKSKIVENSSEFLECEKNMLTRRIECVRTLVETVRTRHDAYLDKFKNCENEESLRDIRNEYCRLMYADLKKVKEEKEAIDVSRKKYSRKRRIEIRELLLCCNFYRYRRNVVKTTVTDPPNAQHLNTSVCEMLENKEYKIDGIKNSTEQYVPVPLTKVPVLGDSLKRQENSQNKTAIYIPSPIVRMPTLPKNAPDVAAITGDTSTASACFGNLNSSENNLVFSDFATDTWLTDWLLSLNADSTTNKDPNSVIDFQCLADGNGTQPYVCNTNKSPCLSGKYLEESGISGLHGNLGTPDQNVGFNDLTETTPTLHTAVNQEDRIGADEVNKRKENKESPRDHNADIDSDSGRKSNGIGHMSRATSHNIRNNSRSSSCTSSDSSTSSRSSTSTSSSSRSSSRSSDESSSRGSDAEDSCQSPDEPTASKTNEEADSDAEDSGQSPDEPAASKTDEEVDSDAEDSDQSPDEPTHAIEKACVQGSLRQTLLRSCNYIDKNIPDFEVYLKRNAVLYVACEDIDAMTGSNFENFEADASFKKRFGFDKKTIALSKGKLNYFQKLGVREAKSFKRAPYEIDRRSVAPNIIGYDANDIGVPHPDLPSRDYINVRLSIESLAMEYGLRSGEIVIKKSTYGRLFKTISIQSLRNDTFKANCLVRSSVNCNKNEFIHKIMYNHVARDYEKQIRRIIFCLIEKERTSSKKPVVIWETELECTVAAIWAITTQDLQGWSDSTNRKRQKRLLAYAWYDLAQILEILPVTDRPEELDECCESVKTIHKNIARLANFRDANNISKECVMYLKLQLESLFGSIETLAASETIKGRKNAFTDHLNLWCAFFRMCKIHHYLCSHTLEMAFASNVLVRNYICGEVSEYSAWTSEVFERNSILTIEAADHFETSNSKNEKNNTFNASAVIKIFARYIKNVKSITQRLCDAVEKFFTWILFDCSAFLAAYYYMDSIIERDHAYTFIKDHSKRLCICEVPIGPLRPPKSPRIICAIKRAILKQVTRKTLKVQDMSLGKINIVKIEKVFIEHLLEYATAIMWKAIAGVPDSRRVGFVPSETDHKWGHLITTALNDYRNIKTMNIHYLSSSNLIIEDSENDSDFVSVESETSSDSDCYTSDSESELEPEPESKSTIDSEKPFIHSGTEDEGAPPAMEINNIEFDCRYPERGSLDEVQNLLRDPEFITGVDVWKKPVKRKETLTEKQTKRGKSHLIVGSSVSKKKRKHPPTVLKSQKHTSSQKDEILTDPFPSTSKNYLDRIDDIDPTNKPATAGCSAVISPKSCTKKITKTNHSEQFEFTSKQETDELNLPTRRFKCKLCNTRTTNKAVRISDDLAVSTCKSCVCNLNEMLQSDRDIQELRSSIAWRLAHRLSAPIAFDTANRFLEIDRDNETLRNMKKSQKSYNLIQSVGPSNTSVRKKSNKSKKRCARSDPSTSDTNRDLLEEAWKNASPAHESIELNSRPVLPPSRFLIRTTPSLCALRK